MKTGGWFANILKKDLERLLRLLRLLVLHLGRVQY